MGVVYKVTTDTLIVYCHNLEQAGVLRNVKNIEVLEASVECNKLYSEALVLRKELHRITKELEQTKEKLQITKVELKETKKSLNEIDKRLLGDDNVTLF